MSKQIDQEEKWKNENRIQVENSLTEIENLINTDRQPQIDAWCAAHLLGIGAVRGEDRISKIACAIGLDEGKGLLVFGFDETLTVYFNGVEGYFYFDTKIPEMCLGFYCYLLSLLVLNGIDTRKKHGEGIDFCTVDELIEKIR